MSEKHYGFSFVKENPGGLGAAIYALTLAQHYAKRNNLTLGLIKNEHIFKKINGVVDDTKLKDRDWTYYFDIPIIDSAKSIWKDCPNGWSSEPPKGEKKIEWYAKMIREVYKLTSHVKKEVEESVKKSGFKKTDLVLHLRMTDKKQESEILPIEEYLEETKKIVRKFSIPRIFVCTDDRTVLQNVKNILPDIEIIWDENESEITSHQKYLNSTLTKSDAWSETISDLKNLTIMSRGKWLVGGRSSYFFRVAELLRYPLPTRNMKDNEIFGKAPYADDDEIFVNPLFPKRYKNFVSDNIDLKKYEDILKNERIVVIPNFINNQSKTEILSDIEKFKEEWWVNAVRPDSSDDRVYITENDTKLRKHVEYAKKCAENGLFAYHFKRTTGNHYKTCNCFACKLTDTFSSREVIDSLTKICNENVSKMGEIFASKYENGNYLTLHHDKDNGNYAFILSLSENWSPIEGGITHFYDYTEQKIYKSIQPKFGQLVIFKLDPEHQMNHFVSTVTSNRNRYSFTGWFFVQ